MIVCTASRLTAPIPCRLVSSSSCCLSASLSTACSSPLGTAHTWRSTYTDKHKTHNSTYKCTWSWSRIQTANYSKAVFQPNVHVSCMPVSHILGYFPHQLSGRSPGVIIGGFPHLGLDFWVVHYNIGAVGKKKKKKRPIFVNLIPNVHNKTIISELTVLFWPFKCVRSDQHTINKRNMRMFPLDIFNPIMTTPALLRRSANHAFPHA